MTVQELAPELSRMIKARHLPQKPVVIEADDDECEALACRFALVAVKSLRASVALDRKGDEVTATGILKADIIQQCAISGDDLPVSIDEKVLLRFAPPTDYTDEENAEIELSAEDCEIIEFTGGSFDLGEAVAQTLGLAIDPYASGAKADDVRNRIGLNEPERENSFAALAALKGD